MGSASIDDFADEILKELKEYSNAVNAELKAVALKTAQAARDIVMDTSPVDSGAYSRSWTRTKTDESSTSIQYTVHSKNRYQIAHLLEFGHAKRGGGRVAAIPHIAPAEKYAMEMMSEEIERCLNRG